MNKLKFKIENNRLELQKITPTVIVESVPETEITLTNFSTYKNYIVNLYFELVMEQGHYIVSQKQRVIDGKVVVSTSRFDDCDNICVEILKMTDNGYVSSIAKFNINDLKEKALVFAKDNSIEYMNLLNDLLSIIHELDIRVGELEKEKEFELI